MGSFNNSYQLLCTERDIFGRIKNPGTWNGAGKASEMKTKVLIGFFIIGHLIDLHGSNREVRYNMWNKQNVKK